MYDPKQRRWGKVRGLEEFLAETKSCSTFSWTGIVGYGGKLALFFPKGVTREIWCAEISLERQEGEGTWGKVEWCHQVMVAGNFDVNKCVAVMV